MPATHSTALTRWSEEPSGGASLNLFTNISDQFQWNWITPAEYVTDDQAAGQAKFLTTIEVTGALSHAATYTAVCRLVCLYTLSRLNDRNLREACHSLTEIYNWQLEQSRLPAPAPTTHVHPKTKPHKITHTKRKPFSFEE